MVTNIFLWTLALVATLYVLLAIRVAWVWFRARKTSEYQLEGFTSFQRWQLWCEERYPWDDEADEPELARFWAWFPLFTPISEGLLLLSSIWDYFQKPQQDPRLSGE